MTTEEKIGKFVCPMKINGMEANWHEWSVKTLALAKKKGFKHIYVKDSKPCSNAV